MNIKVKFDYKSFLQLVLKKFSIVLWIFLALVIIAEGFVVKDSLNKIMTVSDQSLYAGAQLIRVNFPLYDSIEKQIEDNTKYLPQFDNINSPFGLKPLR